MASMDLGVCDCPIFVQTVGFQILATLWEELKKQIRKSFDLKAKQKYKLDVSARDCTLLFVLSLVGPLQEFCYRQDMSIFVLIDKCRLHKALFTEHIHLVLVTCIPNHA